MEKCLKSLLPGGEDVEIIVVDDGSVDRTAEIETDMQKNILLLSKSFTRETAVMDRQSMRGSNMPQAFTLKLWTATTG